jgi:hypothetical protein
MVEKGRGLADELIIDEVIKCIDLLQAQQKRLEQLIQHLDNGASGNNAPLENISEGLVHCLNRKIAVQKKLIADLEEEMEYLREINYSQRCMLDDNLRYLKELEEKLKNSEDH